jgi:hypothetical protein
MDSCSIWSSIVSVHRNVRVGEPEISNAAPAPFASTRVPRGTKVDCIATVEILLVRPREF